MILKKAIHPDFSGIFMIVMVFDSLETKSRVAPLEIVELHV